MGGTWVSTRLLERERELASLDALLEAGEGRVAVIEGPPGIGKTRLLAEVRRLAAERGFTVLAARGGEMEREFPFGVVRQLFEPSVAADASILSGAAAPAQAVFGSLDAGPDASFAMLHALYWLTVDLAARGPLLLAVDDLHWSDRPSLRFVAYLARRLEGLPVLVVCALRPGEQDAVVAEVLDDPHVVAMRPASLGSAAVGELVRDRLGEGADARFAEACEEATGGNPLLLGELMRVAEAEGLRPDADGAARVAELGSRAVSRAVLVRLARAGPEATKAARALAVLGDGGDLWTVAALAGLDDAAAARAVDALTRAEILRPEPPLGFAHPLVAAAVYRDVPPGERALRHEQAARLLADGGAAVERVAAHLLAVPSRSEPATVETLRAAAAQAVAKGAPESAVPYLERALAEPPAPERRPAVLLELGLAEIPTSGASAVQHLGEVHDLLTDPRERARVALPLSIGLVFTGDGPGSARVAGEAAAALPGDDPLRADLEAIDYATALFGVDARRLAELAPYRDGGPGPLVALAAYDWALTGGSAEECSRAALRAFADGDLIRAHNGFLTITAIAVLVAADRDEAVTLLDESLARAHERGSLLSVSSVRNWRGWMQLRRGELDEAEREFDAALEVGRAWGYGGLGTMYRAALKTALHVERGDLVRANDVLMGFDPRSGLLRRLVGGGGEPGVDAEVLRLWLVARMEVLLAEGRYEEALADAQTLERRFGHVTNPALGPWRSIAARALHRLERRDEAVVLAEREVELARAWGAPWALGRALRELGTVRRELGPLEEAVAVLDGSPAQLEHAKALAALGSALRLARKPTEAREPLRRALELADRCGAERLAEHARSELYAAGSRPRTTALRGIDSLTASERRVASLAADGATNRDIAQTLFVTPKTVEVHLTSVYRKLDIRSRHALGPALAAG